MRETYDVYLADRIRYVAEFLFNSRFICTFSYCTYRAAFLCNASPLCNAFMKAIFEFILNSFAKI